MKKVFFILFFVTIFFSCQKGFSTEDNTTNNATTDTVLLLKKFIVIDTTLIAPNDTIYKYSFFYDNFKRCTSFKITDGIDSVEFYNSYVGNDTFINKRKVIFFNTNDSIVEFYKYDNNKKIIADSILEYGSMNSNFFINFQNTTNQSGLVTNSSNGNQFEYNKFVTLRDNSGNLLSIRDSLFLFNGTSYALTETSNSTITYDNKINPFYNLVPKFLANLILESNQVYTFDPFMSLTQKNNILTEVRVSSSSSLYNFNNTNQFTYNSFNYPNIVRIKDNLNNKYYKGFYRY